MIHDLLTLLTERLIIWCVAIGVTLVVFLWQFCRELLRKRAAPDQPWLWRKDWARRRLVPDGSGVGVYWFLFGFVTLLFEGIGIAMDSMSDNESLGAPGVFSSHTSLWLAQIFPSAFLIGAIYVTRRSMRRGGGSILKLTTLPGRIGGELTGELDLPRRFIPAAGIRTCLQCVAEIVKDGDAENDRQILCTLSPEASAPVVSGGAGSDRLKFPVTFRIPGDCSPTSPDDEVEWELIISSCASADDFKAVFIVPVFASDSPHA